MDIQSYEGFTWAELWLLHSPLLSRSPHPIAVTVHQCSKMPQIHYLPSLCYTVFPMIPHTMYTKQNAPQPPSPPSPPALPHPSPLVTTSSFLESLSLLLFCSYSFASLLYSTNEGNHLALVFFRLAYFTERNILQLHPCCWQMVGFVSSYGWIVFHCIYVPHLLYPFIYWWTLRLLPYLGYCK